MSNKLETISDIIKEMRKQDCAGGWCDYLEDFADRLEAAYKRELGNAQKMREALVSPAIFSDIERAF